MKKEQIKKIVKEELVSILKERKFDSPEQAKLAAATANFKDAIEAVDADKMLRTYKDIEKHLKAYFRKERWRY